MTTDPDPVTPDDQRKYAEMAAADEHYDRELEQLEADNLDLLARLEEVERFTPLRPSMPNRAQRVGESDDDYSLRGEM